MMEQKAGCAVQEVAFVLTTHISSITQGNLFPTEPKKVTLLIWNLTIYIYRSY